MKARDAAAARSPTRICNSSSWERSGSQNLNLNLKSHGKLVGDVRYALRSLRAAADLRRVAILTLVLGIGTNTAIFSVIKAVLLNQLPYQDAVAAGRAARAEPRRQHGSRRAADLSGLEDSSRASVPAMAAFRQLRYAFAGGGEPLDVPSVRGDRRTCSPCCAPTRCSAARSPRRKARRAPIAWPSSAARSGSGTSAASPGAIGRTIQLDAQPYTVDRRDAGGVRFPAERATSTSGRRSASIRTTRTAARARRARSTSSAASPTASRRSRRSAR